MNKERWRMKRRENKRKRGENKKKRGEKIDTILQMKKKLIRIRKVMMKKLQLKTQFLMMEKKAHLMMMKI